MVAWVDKHFDSNQASDFIATLKYCLLVNGLLQNQYDIKLFQDYLKRPRTITSEFSRDFRDE